MTDENAYTPDENLVRLAYVDKIKRMKDYPLTPVLMGEDLSDEALNAHFDRFLGSVRADGFMVAQNTMQETVGEAMRDYAERVWAQCSAWHAEQGMGVEGAEVKHNPHTVENRAKLLEEFGL